MSQTPFQIMSNWLIKFRNNKQNSPAHFLENLKRFKRRYQISSRDILENLDALLIENAKDWCLINRNSWRTLSDFFKEFTNTYIDENFLEEIKQKIYLEPRGYNKDLMRHNIKCLLQRDPTLTLHSKTLLNQDFSKNSNLDSEIINIDFSTTLITK